MGFVSVDWGRKIRRFIKSLDFCLCFRNKSVMGKPHHHRSSCHHHKSRWYYKPAPRLGACCRIDPYDGGCFIEEEQECLQTGGYWKGIGTRCDQVSCPQPSGAYYNSGPPPPTWPVQAYGPVGGWELGACRYPGSCAVTNGQNCYNTGGLWLGPGTDCALAAQVWPPQRCRRW